VEPLRAGYRSNKWRHLGRRVLLELYNVTGPYRVIRVKCYLAITTSLHNNNKLLTRLAVLTLRFQGALERASPCFTAQISQLCARL